MSWRGMRADWSMKKGLTRGLSRFLDEKEEEEERWGRKAPGEVSPRGSESRPSNRHFGHLPATFSWLQAITSSHLVDWEVLGFNLHHERGFVVGARGLVGGARGRGGDGRRVL